MNPSGVIRVYTYNWGLAGRKLLSKIVVLSKLKGEIL